MGETPFLIVCFVVSKRIHYRTTVLNYYEMAV